MPTRNKESDHPDTFGVVDVVSQDIIETERNPRIGLSQMADDGSVALSIVIGSAVIYLRPIEVVLQQILSQVQQLKTSKRVDDVKDSSSQQEGIGDP